MAEARKPASGAGDEGRSERVGEALRAAVERTLAATAGSAVETRQRAEALLDEVARRGVAAREEVARRGGAARDQVSRRGGAAREEVVRRSEEATGRVVEAISELRLADRDDVRLLSERIRELEGRLGSLERLLRRHDEGEPKPKAETESPPGAGGDEAGTGA